jgi:hypothetical protein
MKKHTTTINNKEYLVEEVSHIEIQDPVEHTKIYGWTLEYNSKYYNNSNQKEFWHMSWTNRIYNSRQSALNAAIQTGMKEEFRISPLYKMEGGFLRDYKISQVLDDKPKKDKKFEIKAWKLKVDDFIYPYNDRNKESHKKGSIFIQLENGTIVKSGCISKSLRYWRNDIKKQLSNKELFEEVDLKDEKWLHPHLLKELKVKIKLN